MRFCTHCGGLLSTDHQTLLNSCPSCGAIALPEAQFCHHCGEVIVRRVTPPQKLEPILPTEETFALIDTTFTDELPDRIDRTTKTNQPVKKSNPPTASESLIVPEVTDNQQPVTLPLTALHCPQCGRPLPGLGVNCPYCTPEQSEDVPVVVNPTETQGEISELLGESSWGDSVSDMFMGDAFRDLFMSSGLRVDYEEPDSVEILSIHQHPEETKPVFPQPNPVVESGLISEHHVETEDHSDVLSEFDKNNLARLSVVEKHIATASLVTEEERTELDSGKGIRLGKLRFAMPPIPWWGWVGSLLIIILITTYFFILPALVRHEPEELTLPPKPQQEPDKESVEKIIPGTTPQPVTSENALFIVQTKVPVKDTPEKNAIPRVYLNEIKTRATLLTEESEYALIATEDGKSQGWIPRMLKGKPTYILAKDYSKRRISSPVIIAPKSRQSFNHFPRQLKVNWNAVSDTESVSYAVIVQYGNGNGSWWDVYNRGGISGTSISVEFPGAYAGRVLVTANTRDGLSSSSGWTSFKFSQ